MRQKNKKNTIMLIAGMAFLIVIIVFFEHYIINENEKTIKVGAVLPLTGSSSVWGINEERGITLALEELKKNGVNNIEIVIEDSKSNSADAVSAAQKLISVDNVDILYTSLSGPSNAIAPIASQNNKLHLYKAATAKPALNFPDNSIKTGYYDYRRDCSTLADAAMKKDYKKIAYIFAQADFSSECKESIISESGSELSIEEYPFEASKEDFSTIVAKVKDKGYDAIIVTGYNKDFAKLYKKMAEQEISTPVICAGGEDCLDRLENVAPIGTIYFGMDMDKDFKAKLSERYPDSTLLEQSIAATSYDMVRFVSEAYSRCHEKNKMCLKNSIVNSKLDTAQKSEGFEGNTIRLKVKLFQLNQERKIEELKLE